MLFSSSSSDTGFEITSAWNFGMWLVLDLPFLLLEHEGSVDGHHREAHQGRPHGAVEHDGVKLAFPMTDW